MTENVIPRSLGENLQREIEDMFEKAHQGEGVGMVYVKEEPVKPDDVVTRKRTYYTVTGGGGKVEEGDKSEFRSGSVVWQLYEYSGTGDPRVGLTNVSDGETSNLSYQVIRRAARDGFAYPASGAQGPGAEPFAREVMEKVRRRIGPRS